ncbi:MAG TPA: hypothetical protein VFM93_08015 [Candidatus Limnocylindria bacterium]|nr:hypothetical protein [Candidatus Limnocylindria bacterium]
MDMRLASVILLAGCVLSACGREASPAPIQATPGVHQTTVPAGTRAPSNYDSGY